MTNINRETTPTAITDDIISFAADLGAAPPAFLPVSAPADALDGNCFQNVDRQCRLLGGTPMFGRLIYCAEDLYLVSDFHCVVSTPRGLIDVSPTRMGEPRTVFAAFPGMMTDDLNDLHNMNVRVRTYGAAELKAEVEHHLLRVTDADRTTARKNGITLRQLVLSRLPRDPLAILIDDYLRAEGKIQVAVIAAHQSFTGVNYAALEALKPEYDQLDRRRSALFKAADQQRSVSSAPMFK